MAKQLFENPTKSPKSFFGVTLQPGEQKLIDVPSGPTSTPTTYPITQDPVTRRFYGPDGQDLTPLLSGTGLVAGLVAGSAAAAAANTAVLLAAIGSGGNTVQIAAGLGVVSIAATLPLPSNTTVLIGKGTTIKLADGSNRTLVFANKDDQTGNANIYLGGGGTIDCNWQGGAGQSDVRQMGVYFCNVDGLTIENLRILNARKYHVHLASVKNFVVRDIYVYSTPVGADGVHIHGNSSDGLVERISGTSGDDFIALNVKDVSNWLNPTNPALHIGPIRNITIRKILGNVQAANSGNCVALYSNVTGSPTNLTGAAWANGMATLSVAGGATVGTPGEFVQVAGVTPSTWNGNFRVVSSAAGTLTYELDRDPGAYVNGGTVDANLAMTGIRIEDVKPTMVNSGNVVYLATFPSPGFGGVIDDVVVDDISPVAVVSGRPLAVYTSIGTGIFTRIRSNAASGASNELIWVEPGFNHETLIFDSITNTRYFVGFQGSVVRIMSPAKNIKASNVRLLTGAGTSGWVMHNQSSSTTLDFESVELSNVYVSGRRDSLGVAAVELVAANYPALSISNLSAANLTAAVKGNGVTGDVNMTVNGLQVKNLAGGSSAFVFYADGKRLQISLTGYLPRGNAFGAYSVLSNVGAAGAVTMLKASGSPNYTYTFPWIKADTPAAGSSLYCDGHEIVVDVTKVQRWDGAIVRNSNAAAGTLGAAGLVSCQGTAANSWSLLSDPTKKY